MSNELLGGIKKTAKKQTKSKPMYDFEKKFTGYIQIYQNNIPEKTKQQDKYLYIYKHLKLNTDKVYIYSNNKFPEFLSLTTTGYMFIKKGSKIPILPTIEINEFKTNFVDFNTYFSNKTDSNVMIKVSPSVSFLESDPRIVTEHNYLMYLDGTTKKITKEYLESNWLNDMNSNFKNSLEWFNYIKKECPTSDIYKLAYNYYSNINNSTFKKDLSINDSVLFYDIKSINEYKILENIETIFEDLNQNIIFHETYNNKLDEVIKKCEELNVKYKKIDNYSISLKWNDLNSLKLTWKITDFI